MSSSEASGPSSSSISFMICSHLRQTFSLDSCDNTDQARQPRTSSSDFPFGLMASTPFLPPWPKRPSANWTATSKRHTVSAMPALQNFIVLLAHKSLDPVCTEHFSVSFVFYTHMGSCGSKPEVQSCAPADNSPSCLTRCTLAGPSKWPTQKQDSSSSGVLMGETKEARSV